MASPAEGDPRRPVRRGAWVAASRPLRVAVVAPTLSILGGQAVQAQRLLDGWKGDPDVEAWLVPVNPTPPGPLACAVRVKYARTIATQATYWPSLVREIRRADVVHAFSASYFSFLLAPLPAILVARLLGRPVVLNYRSGEAPDHLARSPLARRLIRSCERNAVPSAFLAGVFARYRIPTVIIPNTIDLERFAFRERAPLQPHLVSTRNLEPIYNVPCTLRAFAIVQREHPGATLTIAGGGSQDQRLRQLAASLNLRNVRFVGRVPVSEIWRIYAEGGIYVQSPDIDNMPSSILEAFASGNPVVSTDAGGIPAIVRNGVDGLLVRRDDHAALAAAVLRLLAEPELVQRLTREARASCEQYRWPVIRDRWLQLYRGAVLGGGAAEALQDTARA
ncbi:MAG TPA: glycosyltransferase family 4 protein [Vicinamibacterales bacterium]|nr:glycosyltransferase family 4 protein [Vicinamibacterales bacterium]